jgi:1-phosphofructokinase/tagatose 6-phosphate kinase
VFAGSLPRAVGSQIYAELVGDLAQLGVTTVVDTEGEPMKLALRAGPDLVSPNAIEAEELVGHEFRDEQDRIQALYGLCELGAKEAIITHEEGRCALVGRNHERTLFSVRADPLEPVSAIGAGDVFLAGYLAARYSGRSFEDSLRFAVACGAQSTQHFGAGVLDPREVERIVGEVTAVELEEPAPVEQT